MHRKLIRWFVDEDSKKVLLSAISTEDSCVNFAFTRLFRSIHRNEVLLSAALVATGTFAHSAPLHASNLVWDNTAGAIGPQGGTGKWVTGATTNWWDATLGGGARGNTAYTNIVPGHNVSFGTTA